MRLSLHNWRKFDELNLELPVNSFAISDQNGSGKTSILSSIYTLYTGLPWPDQSFKTCILHDQDYFGISGPDRNLGGQLEGNGRLKIKQEFISSENIKPLVITYTPLDNQLLYLSRTKKLDFLDQILGQIFPKYLINLRKLNKAVLYKQSLLRKLDEDGYELDLALLQTLNYSIWNLSQYFWQIRSHFTNFWDKNLDRLSDWLNLTLKDFKFEYISRSKNQEKYDRLGNTLIAQNLENDLADIFQVGESGIVKAHFENIWQSESGARRVLWGAQRDDFNITLSGEDITSILSRGEMRLLIFWLKYLSIEYARTELDFKEPVWWLLDDAFNELDNTREEILIHEILSKVDWFILTTTRDQKICPSFKIEELVLPLFKG